MFLGDNNDPMNTELNPYQSPLSKAIQPVRAEADAGRSAGLVARGRLIFLSIVVAWMLLVVGLPLLQRDSPSPIALSVACVLWLAAWRGHGWAIALTGFSFALGMLFAVAGAVGAMSAGHPISFCLSVAICGVDAAIVFGLIYSPSLNAFFKHQEQRRLDDARSDTDACQSPTLLPVAPPDGPGHTNSPDESPPTGASPTVELVTIATFDVPVHAEAARMRLDQEGIDAIVADANLVGADWFLSNAVGGAKLQVPAEDEDRARLILSQTQSSLHKPAKHTGGPVHFDCQECGKALTFPAHRRGGVETCPNCGEYVDVPE